MDAAGQDGVGWLAGEGLHANLEGNTLGYIWDRKNVLRGRLGELPNQLLISCTDPV